MALLPFDLSRLPAPNAIEPLDAETLRQQYMTAFLAAWTQARALDPSLPDYDVAALETDPAVILSEAFALVRLLDRGRVNDAVKALLAPLATGADLDNVAARQAVQRLVVIPATDTSPAVMESDAQLLRRYLLSFDRAAAGSRDRYLFEAFSAWPAMLDAAVIGQDVHGRRGDVDLVVLGPGGRAPTTGELAQVRAAVTAPAVKPEATAITVLAARRALYTPQLNLDVSSGPDSDAIKADAASRILAAAAERCKVGAMLPADLMSGVAYGPGVVRVAWQTPLADIAAEPYTAPVLAGLLLNVTVIG